MTAASREKKLAFIRSFGLRAIEQSIIAAVHRQGAEHFLTDEQLDEITTDQVHRARQSAKLNRENRKHWQASLAKQKGEAA